MYLSPEQQVQRLDQLTAQAEQYRSLSPDVLSRSPGPGKWNLIQIYVHLNLAYAAYSDKIDQLLARLPDTDTAHPIALKGISGFFIRSISPQDGKRKWKVKTLPWFRPQAIAPSYDSQEEVFETFLHNQAHLKTAILASTHKDCRKGRLISAIGPIVRFRLPDCFEFILSHAERHMIQAEEAIGKQPSATPPD